MDKRLSAQGTSHTQPGALPLDPDGGFTSIPHTRHGPPWQILDPCTDASCNAPKFSWCWTSTESFGQNFGLLLAWEYLAIRANFG